MHPLRIGGIAVAGVIIAGAFLPWTSASADLGGRHVSGIAGLGILTLIGGIAIGVLVGLWRHGTLVVAAIVAGLVVLIATADLVQALAVLVGFGFLGYVTPGVGLILTVVTGVAALIVTILALPARRDDAERVAPLGASTLPGASTPPGLAGQPPLAGPPAMPAGWYADPFEQARIRYWDGVAWTEETR